jgi:CxxC motif-containing protein (DUF1111 family)
MGSRVSFRAAAAIAVVLSLAALTPIGGDNPAPDFGQPLAGLPSDLLDRFNQGKDEFEQVETVDEGIGPVFNDVSCANCHNVAAAGGGSATLETRFGTMGSDGKFDPLAQFGGSLIQKQGIGAAGNCEYLAETVPAEATIVAGRRTTPLFGLGLVDATPDSTFYALALAEKGNPDGIAGTVSVVTNLVTGSNAVGKFGWKGQNPSLFQFSADAYLNEMGITSPLFPNESCPQGDCSALSCNPVPALNDPTGEDVQKFADFMQFLAPPPRGPITTQVGLGQLLFLGIGCAGCHTTTLVTGSNPVAALNKVAYHPYSDFLLHDMGSLGDGIGNNGTAGLTEMRTAPLWGLRLLDAKHNLLHDGRASSLSDAILRHDGQALAARNAFAGLSGQDQNRVLAFLNTL